MDQKTILKEQENKEKILKYMTTTESQSTKIRSNLYKTLLYSINSRNYFLEIILVLLNLYVQFYIIFKILGNISKIYVHVHNSNSESNSFFLFGTENDKLGSKLINGLKYLDLEEYFSKLLNFSSGIYSYTSDSYNEKVIFYYIFFSLIIVYCILAYISKYFEISYSFIILILQLFLTKPFFIIIVKTCLTIVVEIINSSIYSIQNSIASNHPFIVILAIICLTLTILLVIYSEISLNDFQIFEKRISISEFDCKKLFLYIIYYILNAIFLVVTNIILFSKENNILESGFIKYLYEAIRFICLFKIIIISYVNFSEIKYPFIIDEFYLYYKLIGKTFALKIDLIFSIQIFLHYLFGIENIFYEFAGFLICIVLGIILTIIEYFLVCSRINDILSVDINKEKESKTIMCFIVLFWSRCINIQNETRYSMNILDLQLKQHKIQCFDQNCVCNTYPYCPIIDHIKNEIEKNNLNKDEDEYYFKEYLPQNFNYEETKFINADFKDQFEIYSNDQNLAFKKLRKKINVQFYYTIIDKLQIKHKSISSFVNLIQVQLLTYFFKTTFQGVYRLMVLERSLKDGYKMVSINYYILKDYLMEYLSKVMFNEGDIINISKLTSFEKGYNEFNSLIYTIFKNFIKHVKIIKKSKINEKMFYNLVRSIIVDLEKADSLYKYLYSIIPNELRILKLKIFISSIINYDIEYAQNMFQDFLSTLSNKINMSSRQNIYFKDNACPGILCFSGNLSDLATITYCNRRFHEFLDQKNNLVGSNVNNIMHELFAKHHDWFILKFYQTNKIHNINKDNVVFAQTAKNILVPLRQMVKVLPSLKNGIYYIGYDLLYKAGNSLYEGYLLFDPNKGSVFSFDSTFKTLFNLNTDSIFINSNNQVGILNINHLFSGLLSKIKNNQILDNIDFEVTLNFKDVSDQLRKDNIIENSQNNIIELNEIVNNIKNSNKIIPCIASITKCQICNGLIKFAILKIKLNNLLLADKTMKSRDEVVNNNLQIEEIKSKSEITENSHSQNFSHKKDINVKDINTEKLKNDINLTIGKFSIPKLSKYNLIFLVISFSLSLIIIIIFIIIRFKFTNSIKEKIEFNQNMIKLLNQITEPIKIEMFYLESNENRIKNDVCYNFDNKINLMKTSIDLYISDTHDINKLFEYFINIPNLRDNFNSANQIPRIKNSIVNLDNLNERNYYRIDFNQDTNQSFFDTFIPDKYTDTSSNFLIQPLKDLLFIYQKMKEQVISNLNLLNRFRIIFYWNFLNEANNFAYYLIANTKNYFTFDNDEKFVIINCILSCIIMIIILIPNIVKDYLKIKYTSNIVKSFFIMNDVEINAHYEMANKYLDKIELTEADSYDFEIINDLLKTNVKVSNDMQELYDICSSSMAQSNINRINVSIKPVESNLNKIEILNNLKVEEKKEKPKKIVQKLSNLKYINSEEETINKDINDQSTININTEAEEKLNQSNIEDDPLAGKILKNIKVDYKIFFYRSLYLAGLLIFQIVAYFILIENSLLMSKSIKLNNNFNIKIFSIKSLAFTKQFNNIGFEVSNNYYNYIKETFYNNKYALEDLFHDIIKDKSNKNFEEFFNKTISRDYLCSFKNETCCKENKYTSLGYYFFLLFFEKNLVMDNYDKKIETFINIYSNYLEDFEVSLNEDLVKLEDSCFKKILFNHSILIAFLVIYISLYVIYLIINFFNELENTQIDEKILSLIPKVELNENKELIKHINSL